MGILTAFVLSLPGLLAQAEPSAPASSSQEVRPVLPGEGGHILKLTREMLDLAKTHDSDRRVDLFLRQARERLMEREALEKAAPAPERERLGRGLGASYEKLTGVGAAGAIECGAAEGRDMSAAATRYVEAARQHWEAWSRIAEAQLPAERPHYEGAIAVSAKAPERVREAQEAGKTFLAQERAREEARSRARDRDKTPEEPKAPSTPEKTPAEPPKGPIDPGRRDVDPDRKDKDRKEDREEPKGPEHHPTHPHRPHR